MVCSSFDIAKLALLKQNRYQKKNRPRQFLKSQFAILSALCCPMVFAWNATGHRVIAQVAYHHLTPHAKQRFNAYNRLLNHKRHSRQHNLNFIEASVWLDKMRYSSDLSGEMHYIDIPFSKEKNVVLPKIAHTNALTALTQAESTLKSEWSNAHKRAVAFRILLHVVGDLHQPLHAVTYVSSSYPKGDQGGNLIKLPVNPVADVLHAYWDKGAGVLQSMNAKDIKQYAALLEARWPCQNEIKIDDFDGWAQASHQLAEKEAYACLKDDEHIELDAAYQRRAMMISESQLALAGCRLAALLNQIDATTRAKPATISRK